MHEQERPSSVCESRLELGSDRLERLTRFVKATFDAKGGQGLDLGAVVVCGNEDLVSRRQAERAHAVPESVATEGIEDAAPFFEREGRAHLPHVCARRKRRPDREARERHRPASASARLASGRP